LRSLYRPGLLVQVAGISLPLCFPLTGCIRRNLKLYANVSLR
jgi:hypothetical protein